MTMPNTPEPNAKPSETVRELLPGMAAISLYLLILAGLCILTIASGQTPAGLGWPVFIIFSALFICASMGLTLRFRWAWSLALGAVVLVGGLFFWRFGASHGFYDIAQGLLNLVFFLYLIRPEVRERLR